MTTRTLGMWTTIILAAGSLTGCAGSGSNANFQRPTPPATARVTPPTAIPTASSSANNGWCPADGNVAERPGGIGADGW